MTTQELEQEALSQYKDLRDTVMTLEAMRSEARPSVEWEAFKASLDV